MKLLSKISFILVTSMLPIFFLGSIAFYFILKSASENEIRSELASQMDEVILELGNQPPDMKEIYLPTILEIKKIPRLETPEAVYKDTVLASGQGASFKLFSLLTKDVEVDGEPFRIVIFKSRLETDKLIETITLVMMIIVILFLLLIYTVNRFIFNRQWTPFLKTIENLKAFDVDRMDRLEFIPMEIREFNLLNEALMKMTSRIERDYNNMKEFTGNVSHEIQTPLTIIRQKSELLLQSGKLTEEQALLISDIQKSTSRLAKITRSLTLLNKIENRQFQNREKVSVIQVVGHILDSLDSIISAHEIHLETDLQKEVTLLAEPMLIEVLIMNLIKNAIFHNREKGFIRIESGDEILAIHNSSHAGDLSGINIFDRHVSLNPKSESMGLGLALVTTVCDLYNYRISYHFEEGVHSFSVHFSQSS